MSEQINSKEYIVCKAFSDSHKKLLNTGDTVPAYLTQSTLKNYVKNGLIVKRSEFNDTPEAKSMVRFREMNADKINESVEKALAELAPLLEKKSSEHQEALTLMNGVDVELKAAEKILFDLPEDADKGAMAEAQAKVDGFKTDYADASDIVEGLASEITSLQERIEVEKNKIVKD